ncbi:hypothetical protein LTR28_009413 [Elasticomyces elasticus]|nr:hypothetical protein LTR28_009413 [Elasticomyces elasticus]
MSKLLAAAGKWKQAQTQAKAAQEGDDVDVDVHNHRDCPLPAREPPLDDQVEFSGIGPISRMTRELLRRSPSTWPCSSPATCLSLSSPWAAYSDSDSITRTTSNSKRR